MTAKVGEIHETHARNAVFLDPLEDWAEVRPSATLGFEMNRFRWPEFLGRLDGRVAINDMNCFRLGFADSQRLACSGLALPTSPFLDDFCDAGDHGLCFHFPHGALLDPAKLRITASPPSFGFAT